MNYLLPYKYQFSHNFCMYMIHELIEILDNGKALGFYEISINYNDEDNSTKIEIPSELSSHDLFNWLENNGYIETTSKMYFISLFTGILYDLCNFLYEAMSCCERGKITITYALLRKPFRENLYYLEWILADPEQFINEFRNNPATHFNLNHVGEKEKVKLVLDKVRSKIQTKHYDLDLIYNLRFNKNFDGGFERYWNQALHLVTTKGKLATSPQNFNFIYAENRIEDLHSFWDHIYACLPFLIMYTVEVSEVLMSIIAEASITNLSASYLRRIIGFLLWKHEQERFLLSTEKNNSEKIKEINIVCIHCKSTLPFSLNIYSDFFELGKATCLNCQK